MRDADDDSFRWRFDRCLARVVPVLEELLADYATSYCMRAFQRRPATLDDGAGVRWLIDGAVVVDLVYAGRGPARLVVHDVALVRPLRRRLRSRHVTIEYGAPESG